MSSPVPGQIPAFFPDVEERPVAEVRYIGPGVKREEIKHRAGTKLDHRWCHKIIENGRLWGVYDESQRVFQTGGELKRFVFWKKHVASLPIVAWRRIGGTADWIEIIDHDRNECWRIATAKFVKHAIRYDAGVGERIGCPLEYWTVIRSDNTIKQEGAK